MKRIIKNKSPEKFETWKTNKTRTWKTFKRNSEIKHLVRNSLLNEQGYICCYCGKKIENNELSTIEHLKCKDNYKNLEMDYNNLLISCNGGREERSIRDEFFPLSCDAHKDNDNIEVTPLDINCEEEFLYSDSGEIIGRSDKAERTIEKLNLNNSNLIHLRKAALEPFVELIDDIEENIILIDYYSNKQNGKYEEYSNAILGYLKLNI